MTRSPLLYPTCLAAASLGMAAVFLPLEADAHHSAAMFDNAKVEAVTGTVKEFQWRSPHVIVAVVSKGASGVDTSWNFECSAPGILVRNGWGAHAVNAGDKVQIQMHPMRNGDKAGLVLTITTPSGAVLKDHGGVDAPALHD